MPVSLTYNSLKTDLLAYGQRGNATTDEQVNAQIPLIINNTERRMARELKIQGFQRVYVSAFIAGTPLYQKPDRWRETISMRFGTGASDNTSVPLRELSYEAANAYWPNRASTGTPRFYADADYNNFLVVPVPAAANPYEMVLWELPALLDDANQTNWLTKQAPNALLHGALHELFNFLGNNENAQKWRAEYDRDMAGLAGEDLQKILDRYYKRSTS